MKKSKKTDRHILGLGWWWARSALSDCDEPVDLETIDAWRKGLLSAKHRREVKRQLANDPRLMRQLEELIAADELVHCVLARNVLEILLNLRARRKTMAPVRIELEGVAVEVRGDVAADPRIGVLAPGATQAVAFLVDDEVCEAGLLQPDRAEDARHPCPDDREAQIAPRLGCFC